MVTGDSRERQGPPPPSRQAGSANEYTIAQRDEMIRQKSTSFRPPPPLRQAGPPPEFTPAQWKEILGQKNASSPPPPPLRKTESPPGSKTAETHGLISQNNPSSLSPPPSRQVGRPSESPIARLGEITRQGPASSRSPPPLTQTEPSYNFTSPQCKELIGEKNESSCPSPPPLPARPQSGSAQEVAPGPPCGYTLKALERIHTERVGPKIESFLTIHRGTSGVNAVVATTDCVIALSASALTCWSVRSGQKNWDITMGLDSPTACATLSSRWALLGLKSGTLLTIEISTGSTVAKCSVSSQAILHILQHRGQALAIDNEGWAHVWKIEGDKIPQLDKTSVSKVMGEPLVAHFCADETLWVARDTLIEVHHVAKGRLGLLARFDCARDLGLSCLDAGITCIASLDSAVVCGHQDGTVSRWHATDCTPIDCYSTGPHRITALVAGTESFWVASSTGKISILSSTTMQVVNEWKPHSTAIVGLARAKYPRRSLYAPMVSMCDSGSLQVWDSHNLERMIDLKLRELRSEYCKTREIRCQVCSWNVDSQRPPDDDEFWNKWLGLNYDPEIIVIGLQEVIDLQSKSANAMLLLNSNNKNAAQQEKPKSLLWIERILRFLAQTVPDTMSLVASESMVGLMIVVFAKHTVTHLIKHVHRDQVKTGLAGLHGNKGALVCRLLIDDTSICFVNCHLAAGHPQSAARQVDLNSIIRSARLSPLAVPEGVFLSGPGDLIHDHEHCVLFGDLNYRIEMDRDAVQSAMQDRRIQSLLQNDQLMEQIRTTVDHPLTSYKEAPIAFLPTYKYDRGTNRLDSSEKQRIPAYCDRVLFRSFDEASKIISYNSIHDMVISDHRPVCATIRLGVKEINTGKQALMRIEVARELITRILEQ